MCISHVCMCPLHTCISQIVYFHDSICQRRFTGGFWPLNVLGWHWTLNAATDKSRWTLTVHDLHSACLFITHMIEKRRGSKPAFLLQAENQGSKTLGSSLLDWWTRWPHKLWGIGIISGRFSWPRPGNPHFSLAHSLLARSPWHGCTHLSSHVLRKKNMALRTDSDIPHQNNTHILNFCYGQASVLTTGTYTFEYCVF